MSKKEDNPSSFVRTEICLTRHKTLAEDMGVLKEDCKAIKKALIGDPFDPKDNGLMGAVEEIKKNSKSKMSGKDKAVYYGGIAIAIITAISSIVVAYIR